MTPATLEAVAAGALAAAGVLEVAELRAAAARSRRHRRGGVRDAIARLGRRLGVPEAPRDLAARLAAAGLDGRLGVADAMAIKVGTSLVAALAAVPPAAAAPGRLGVLLLMAAPAAGYLVLDVLLRRRARRRAAAMALELPDVVDLLRVALEAGLPATRALSEVGRRRGGLLAGELARTAAQVELGIAQDAALAALHARAPVPGVAALVAALGRAARHGAPPAQALAALAADARAERARELRDRAARAAPKIQLVVALLLVPAVMLLVAAGLVDGLT